MADAGQVTRHRPPENGEVRLRPVEDGDIDVFFEQQADPVAVEMAAFPSRDKERFAAHWAKVRANGDSLLRTVLADGAVAGNVVSWQQDDMRLVGYWFGREFWGRGIATRALARFLLQEPARPVRAHVAAHNIGSIRVLEKAGFRRDRVSEAEAPPAEDGIEELVFVLTTE